MPKFLDLDQLPTGVVERVLKLNGKEHALKLMSVGDFIDNTRLIQSQGDTHELASELETMVAIIQRGFPTIAGEELMALTLAQLNRILEFVQSSNAPDAVPDTAKDEAVAGANPPVRER